MLCEAAHHASRPTHPLHPYFALLCAKRGYKMATIAVAHRLARITFAMLRDGAWQTIAATGSTLVGGTRHDRVGLGSEEAQRQQHAVTSRRSPAPIECRAG
jgi:hypothetical protein